MSNSSSVRTDNYNELVEKTKEYFKRYKLDRYLIYDVVHDIIMKFPRASLEKQTEMIPTAYNRIKRNTDRCRLHEKDLEKLQIAVRFSQVVYLSIDKNRLKHNLANKNGHFKKRKDFPVWAHERDMLNADHQKQRCHNEDDYRLKKNARNRKYYKNKCEKAAMDNRNT